jgi:hypothetical protein
MIEVATGSRASPEDQHTLPSYSEMDANDLSLLYTFIAVSNQIFPLSNFPTSNDARSI